MIALGCLLLGVPRFQGATKSIKGPRRRLADKQSNSVIPTATPLKDRLFAASGGALRTISTVEDLPGRNPMLRLDTTLMQVVMGAFGIGDGMVPSARVVRYI